MDKIWKKEPETLLTWGFRNSQPRGCFHWHG